MLHVCGYLLTIVHTKSAYVQIFRSLCLNSLYLVDPRLAYMCRRGTCNYNSLYMCASVCHHGRYYMVCLWTQKKAFMIVLRILISFEIQHSIYCLPLTALTLSIVRRHANCS